MADSPPQKRLEILVGGFGIATGYFAKYAGKKAEGNIYLF